MLNAAVTERISSTVSPSPGPLARGPRTGRGLVVLDVVHRALSRTGWSAPLRTRASRSRLAGRRRSRPPSAAAARPRRPVPAQGLHRTPPAVDGSKRRGGSLARTIARRSSRPPSTNPSERAWTRILPMAVASTGPANTGSLVASAVSWHRSSFLRPTADDVDDVDGPPRQPSRVVDGARGRLGEAVQNGSDERGPTFRDREPCGSQPSRDPRRHVAGRQEGTVVGVEGQPATRQRGRGVEQRSEPFRLAHALPGRCDSWSSHRPVTLRRYRMVASTPPSLVKLASRLASVRIGARVSTPTRDHVPDEMYANVGRSAGTGLPRTRCRATRRVSRRSFPAAPSPRVPRAATRHARCPGRRAAVIARHRDPAAAQAPRPNGGSADRAGQSSRRASARRSRPRSANSRAGQAGIAHLARCRRPASAGGLQLVQGVERHGLEAVARIEGGRVDLRMDALHRRQVARIAMVDRIGDEALGGIEEADVDTPCVDADAGRSGAERDACRSPARTSWCSRSTSQ